MWRWLDRVSALNGVTVLAPALLGYPPNPPVAVGQMIGSRDDVAHIRALVPPDVTDLHLVGHSYGGRLALVLASELAPLVRSVWVYEPVLFGALRNDPTGDPEARSEANANFTTPDFLDPALAGTESWCRAFIDYWNGAGAFERMTPAQRASVIAVSGKIFAELHDIALGSDTFADWHRAVPMTIAYGSRTPHAAQAIARALAGVNPHAVLDRVVEAGHMAPLTEPARVSPGMEAHFRRVGIT